MSSATERALPHNLEAERALLGSVLLDNGALNIILEFVRKDDFFADTHRIVFEKMLALFEKTHTIDLVTLSEELSRDGLIEKAGGASYLAALTDGIPIGTTASVSEYAHIVKEKAIVRQLINASSNVISRCLEGFRMALKVAKLASAPRHDNFVCPTCRQKPLQGEHWRCDECVDELAW